MPRNGKNTWYAPAELADESAIRRQVEHFIANPTFSRLYDAIPDLVMILNQQRQIVFANAALLHLLGYEQGAFTGGQRPGEIFNCTHASDNAGNGCGTTEFCTTCGAVQAIVGGLGGRQTAQECHIVQVDGNALDLTVWATPLVENGETFVVVVVKDVSPENRRKSLERIFFHDVMNIIGAIWGSADLLRQPNPPELDAALKDNLVELSQRLVGEVNAQQELAAAESHDLTIHPSVLNALEFLRDVARVYQKHELANGRAVEIAPGAQAIEFSSDRVLLDRVIGNMVKNALEASAPGDTITLTCERIDQSIQFSVHNPQAMPRRVQLQVFQRSYSTKGTGRGLGTFSMKLLSERYLGGSVAFDSSPKQGTTFRAAYPLRLEES